MSDDVIGILAALIALTFVVCWAASAIAVIRKLFHCEMEQPPPVGPSTFMFIAWSRCDTLGKPTEWHATAGGDDPTEMLTNLETHYPLEHYDHLVLPNGERPDGTRSQTKAG
jgi:hypothetical protein